MDRHRLVPTSAVVALGACLLSTLAACQRPTGPPAASAPAQAPVRGGTAVVATAIDFEQVNELLDNGNDLTTELGYQMFWKLVSENPDYQDHPPTFAPQIATRWEWSSDHLALTFFLRPDLQWSDGAPITADDVRFTWQAQRDPAVGWIYADAKEAITDVAVVDVHTVRFTFDHVYASMFLDAVEGAVLPRHAWGALPFTQWRQQPTYFRDHLVVSGPFTLAEVRPQQQFALVRNPRFVDPNRPYLDRIVFRVIPDKPAQLLQLETGDVDFVQQVAPAEGARLAANPELELHELWARQYEYIAWNTRLPLFADAEVRRAMTLAVDRQALVDTVWRGRGRVGWSPYLASTWATNRSLEPWPYDPSAARAILAARGWTDHDGDGLLDRDGRPFRFELVTNTGNQTRADAQVAIQAQLRKIGVDAVPRLVEGATLTTQLLNHEFEATIGGWAIDTSMNARYFFHSAEAKDGYNFGSYANPEVDRLIDEAARVAEPAAAKPLFDRLQVILHRDQPYTFLCEPQRLHATRRRLHDVRPNPLFVFANLADWWVAP
jgi:peptide/nickel transport system substrate-binding protein